MNPYKQGTLPDLLGLPDLKTVHRENRHGTNWVLIDSGDQGANAEPWDRFYAEYKCREDWRATYFHFSGSWSLGTN